MENINNMEKQYLYLTLYHGRNSPTELLEDWGFEGPTFGPLEYVQQTYGTHIKFQINGEYCDLNLIDELVHYDGKYYGDFTIYNSRGEETTKYDESKK